MEGEDAMSANTSGHYDRHGFDAAGLHKATHTPYDTSGYDFNGRDVDGFNRSGYDRYGFNAAGLHRDTGTPYAPSGYNCDGRDCRGYDRSGLDANGHALAPVAIEPFRKVKCPVCRRTFFAQGPKVCEACTVNRMMGIPDPIKSSEQSVYIVAVAVFFFILLVVMMAASAGGGSSGGSGYERANDKYNSYIEQGY